MKQLEEIFDISVHKTSYPLTEEDHCWLDIFSKFNDWLTMHHEVPVYLFDTVLAEILYDKR